MIVGGDDGGNGSTLLCDDVDVIRLEDEIPDREDEAVLVDEDAASHPVDAERLCAARVRESLHLHADDGVRRVLEVLVLRFFVARDRWRRRRGRGKGGQGKYPQHESARDG